MYIYMIKNWKLAKYNDLSRHFAKEKSTSNCSKNLLLKAYIRWFCDTLYTYMNKYNVHSLPNCKYNGFIAGDR